MHLRHLSSALAISFLLPLAAANAAIPRFSQVSPDIFRGGQPETVADFDALKAKGIRTVIYLRTEDPRRERDIVNRLGMNFEYFPIDPLSYPSEATVNAALTALTDPKLQPVFIHCQHGKDRTGLLVGLYRVHHEQWSAPKAYTEMKSFGFSSFLVGLKRYFDDHTP